MGNLFRATENLIDSIEPTDVFVEIGSARGGEGSTHYFADLAQRRGTVLHSVDIDDRQHIFRYIPNVIGHRAPGSEWARDVFPGLGKTIACLYLDNYDYNYWIGNETQFVQDQKAEYLEKHNLVMTNQECVIEHLRQITHLLPYMSPNSVVICDDTYLYNDCWVGKCAAVVPYLMINGFRIVKIEHIEGSSYGVILTNSNRDTIL